MFFQKGDSVWFKGDRKKYNVWVSDEEIACLHNPFYTTGDESLFAVRMFANGLNPETSYQNTIRIIDKNNSVVLDRKKKVAYLRQRGDSS